MRRRLRLRWFSYNEPCKHAAITIIQFSKVIKTALRPETISQIMKRLNEILVNNEQLQRNVFEQHFASSHSKIDNETAFCDEDALEYNAVEEAWPKRTWIKLCYLKVFLRNWFLMHEKFQRIFWALKLHLH